MSETADFVKSLGELGPGELGLLRTHAGRGLDESVEGFDLFAGLWWPLREKSKRAPRREVAWLIAKLYAFRPVPHQPGSSLAMQMKICQPQENKAKVRFRERFDQMLQLPLGQLETALQWAISTIDSNGHSLDWIQLTDDLSIWERERTRLKWAEQFIGKKEENENVD